MVKDKGTYVMCVIRGIIVICPTGTKSQSRFHPPLSHGHGRTVTENQVPWGKTCVTEAALVDILASATYGLPWLMSKIYI